MIFLAPLLLIGLLSLPALWWLVKAMPPQPRRQDFSSLILLRHLHSRRQDAAHAPFWLLVFRLVTLTLLIVAFARPLWLPKHQSTSSHARVLILDDGWASFPHWSERQKAALALGEQTLRAGGNVTLFLSGRHEDGHLPTPFTPHDRASLERYINSLHPHPWTVNRHDLAQRLSAPDQHDLIRKADVIILSDGLAQGEEQELKAALSPAYSVRDMRWSRCDLLRLRRDTSSPATLRVLVETLPHCGSEIVPLNGLTLNDHGQYDALAHWDVHRNTSQELPLPDALKNSLDALIIPGAPIPAGMILISNGYHQRPVGLLHLNGDTAPLTGHSFYLENALTHISVVQDTRLSSLLSHPLSLLMAPDGTLSTDDDLTHVLQWVHQGGILVRFAGDNLANQDNTALSPSEKALLSVPLLHGMRQLGGSMSWGAPQNVAPFPDTSPFYGLTIPYDVRISRQVLAQPSNELQEHVWATLADGTPLVTARHEGQGLVILFHITPTADWSNLPLTGLFPQMIERLVRRAPALIEGTIPHTSEHITTWPAWKRLSLTGSLEAPLPSTLAFSQLSSFRVDERHPVGLYGDSSQASPLNLADHMPPLTDEPPLGLSVSPTHLTPERPLWPSLGLAALILLMIDMTMSIGRIRGFSIRRFAWLGLFLFSASFHHAALAEHKMPTIPQGALEIRLAHIITGDHDTDLAVHEGLEGLTHFVNQRSTTHLGDPLGVMPDRDDLAFYPLLYWPITPSSQTTPAQDAALNHYMQHGGMLLIDEMGAGSSLDSSGGSATHNALKRVTAGLNIPPLMPLNDQHTLSHTFYLLKDYPGRITGQAVYVARVGNDDNEDVSPVIIGNADWARAWAKDQRGNPPFAVIPDGETQRTIAYRFGFNTVIYALTGNYKNDQRHYPEMLHRLKGGAPNDSLPSENEDTP